MGIDSEPNKARIRLSREFLSPYRSAGDPFRDLLGRATYLSKFSRSETWTDTIRRVVEDNVSQDPTATVAEAEALFEAFWTMKGLPPGRGLWTGGVPGIPVSARYNCHAAEIRSSDEWRWACLMLMSGGGVGLTLNKIDRLPEVNPYQADLLVLCKQSHRDIGAVKPDLPFRGDDWYARKLVVPDCREGWADTLKTVIDNAYRGYTTIVDVSNVRPNGTPLKTFGGLASGPGPFVEMLRAIWSIIRGAAGRKLTSVECLDITNHIGKCIAAGGTRRSALIVLGDVYDREFRLAKHDYEAVKSHRFTSNNSIVFRTRDQFEAFNWEEYVDELRNYGEPGILNLARVHEEDPSVVGCNPCGELLLHQREACCLSEVFPAKIPYTEIKRILELVTRYTLRQRMHAMEDPQADEARVWTMRIGVGLGGIVDFEWGTSEVALWRSIVKTMARNYADELGVNQPIACTTVKPSGTISLLAGSSPGMHAPWAPHYIRRARIAKNEPIAEALMEAGVPHEECVYTKQWVFEFPMSAPNAGAYAVTESISSQFKRKMDLEENWADNAVSATLTFDEGETSELVSCLKQYAPAMKSLSCLPKSHGYEQAPYEAITRERYEEMFSRIDHAHPLVGGSKIEDMECAGGVCPI